MTKKLLIAFFAMFMTGGIAFGQSSGVHVTVISPTASRAVISITIEAITESQQQTTIYLRDIGPSSGPVGPNSGSTTFSIPALPADVTRLIIEVTTNAIAMEHAVYIYDGYVTNATFDFR